MATYVHAPGVSNIYHWCRNCSNYPSNPQGAKTKRLEGQLCDQCRDKEKQGTCKS
jgi:hypothetical protein